MAIRTNIARKAAVNPSRFSARAAQGVSPHFYITGWEASAASFANESVQVKKRARQITDAGAKRVEEAQRVSGSFIDRSGDTRDSIENTPVEHADGYVRSVGPTHYVARFLVFGTVKMSPKWDLYGASQAGINWWSERMEEVSTL